MANKSTNDDMPISKGLVYKSKNSGEEVVPFLVDMGGTVVYAPVGSAREVRTDAVSFRDEFELNEDQFTESKKSQKAAETQSKNEPNDSFASANATRVATGDGTTKDGTPTKAPEPKTNTDRTNDVERVFPDITNANKDNKEKK